MREFSYQLYSSRNFPPLEETLRMVAEVGYTQVEGYGALYNDADLVKSLEASLDTVGLTMPTAHFSLELVSQQPDEAIRIARSLNMKAVFVPFLAPDDRPTDGAGWAAFGETLAEAGKPLLDAGLGYGWHNHDFEFVDLGGEDRPLDLIMQASDDLMLELDVAWVQVSAQDPAAWIAKYSDRILSCHIKDIAPEGEKKDEDGWADVGQGVMDWPVLMRALKDTPVQYLVMEHDNPSDDRRFATASLAAARTF